ncbi:MAG: hypothetical protein H0X39_09100 [Actinobacteria bacterium]|nr:hypothetical protein [Actinomycetota bacterium]
MFRLEIVLDHSTVTPLLLKDGMYARLWRESSSTQVDQINRMKMPAILARVVEVLHVSDGTCRTLQSAHAEVGAEVDDKHFEIESGTSTCHSRRIRPDEVHPQLAGRLLSSEA